MHLRDLIPVRLRHVFVPLRIFPIPVPVIQVACMVDLQTIHTAPERDALIRGLKSLDLQCPILQDLSRI